MFGRTMLGSVMVRTGRTVTRQQEAPDRASGDLLLSVRLAVA